MSRSQVTSWLKGKSTPRLQNLRRIALTFNISSNYFIGISEKPYPIKPNALK
ncbi:MAG: helix-turn-helix transcriptional regulator [Clostridia bacterium]|nr:helix-turn-helix transcriptional regulator [Clostridia bacterium]